MGYTTVQISAIGKDIPAERIREVCDEAGVEVVLTHNSADRILYDTDALIAEHNLMDCNYIGLGCMPDKYRSTDWISHFADDFLEPAKKIAAAGKLFMYHNQNWDRSVSWNIFWKPLRRMNWALRWILTGSRLQAVTYATGLRN